MLPKYLSRSNKVLNTFNQSRQITEYFCAGLAGIIGFSIRGIIFENPNMLDDKRFKKYYDDNFNSIKCQLDSIENKKSLLDKIINDIQNNQNEALVENAILIQEVKKLVENNQKLKLKLEFEKKEHDKYLSEKNKLKESVVNLQQNIEHLTKENSESVIKLGKLYVENRQIKFTK